MKEALAGIDQYEIQKALLRENVKWTFNPPLGSHYGGVWELIIRIFKKILYSILRQQPLEDEGLQTALCEVEAILNDRPITTVSEDAKDPEALTPNHLLLMKGVPMLPPGLFQRDDIYSRKRWKQVQYICDLFWKRWIREYLPLMQKRQKWNTIKINLKIGDIVLIIDDTSTWNSWH